MTDPAAIATASLAADVQIRPFVRETPVEFAHTISAQYGCDAWLKMECFQSSGSFKARGAFNALLCLDEATRARGVVTASTGNHANAMATAMSALGIEGEIFLPSNASPAKVNALRAKGATLRLLDEDPGVAEQLARADGLETGRAFVSPYNDPDVIAGQGTVAVELLRQCDPIDVVLVPVGGGGLIAGITGVLKAQAPHVEVIGVQPATSPVMAVSVRAGELLEPPWEPSLSDATVGWSEPGTITFAPCRDLVDDWILVSEDQIAGALRRIIAEQSVLVEGAAALGVAAIEANPNRFAGKTVVSILSGSRIPLPVLQQILAEQS